MWCSRAASQKPWSSTFSMSSDRDMNVVGTAPERGDGRDDLHALVEERLARLSSRLLASPTAPIDEDTLREARLLNDLTVLTRTRVPAPPKPRSHVPFLVAVTAGLLTIAVF